MKRVQVKGQIPGPIKDKLKAICQSEGISEAEGMRRSLKLYIESKKAQK